MKNEYDVRDHFKEAADDASKIGEAIRDYLRFAVAPPLAVLLLQKAYGALAETANAIGDLLTPDEAPAEAPPSHVEAKRAREAGDHRHKFGPDNRCAVAGCGQVKSANGRKPAAPPEGNGIQIPPDTRTLPLPAARPLGDAAADRFVDGGQGSSGVVRR